MRQAASRPCSGVHRGSYTRLRVGTYNNAARDLIGACDAYTSGRLELGVLQGWILNVADQIALVDERQVREVLEDAESKIEGVRFSSEDIDGIRFGTEERDEILAFVAEVRARMVEYTNS